MDTATPRPQSTLSTTMPRKKGPPTPLRIDTPAHNPSIVPLASDTSASASTLSSATSDTDSFVFPTSNKPRSLRNMKKLSLSLHSAQSSTNSLFLPTPEVPAAHPETAVRRRLSVVSLPASTSSYLHRKDEDGDGSPSAPYLDGPVQVLPGIWLGSEDNARDWKGLIERGIKSILNVAKEVSTPFDTTATTTTPLRSFMSAPDLKTALNKSNCTYYPAHIPSGRPGMHYLKLHWSHGQSNLVADGFPEAMAFVDSAIERGDGVLVHCQCGVSRSATLIIALVMRAAAQRSPSVPSEVWALKGMQEAYNFVKLKSKWVGPNMSLIYQLLDYERVFKTGSTSPTPSDHSSVSEEEWGRRRLAMEEAEPEENDRESVEIMREARALDQAMEDRIVARKSSLSSLGSGLGMGTAWRTRYSGRARTGSIASVATSGSVLSEKIEEDEESELLEISGSSGGSSADASSSNTELTEDELLTPAVSFTDIGVTPRGPVVVTRHSLNVQMPPSAPAHKKSFSLPPPPATAIKASFGLSSRWPKSKTKHRPQPLSLLPPVPSSPITPVNITSIPPRTRKESRRPDLPPLRLRNPDIKAKPMPPVLATPSQTLFVFPPSPTLTTCTPSTMTLTSNSSYPFPSVTTPRVSTFTSRGNRRSFIGLSALATPTTASSRVDARGWVGLTKS